MLKNHARGISEDVLNEIANDIIYIVNLYNSTLIKNILVNCSQIRVNFSIKR